MNTIVFKIAWRNIWRHSTRSLVVVTAVALGLWAGVFVVAFYFGMINQRVQDVIENEVSHLQLHHPQFKDENNIIYDIKNSETLLEKIRADASVKKVSSRIITTGMIGSARGNSGVKINGIHPEDEDALTNLSRRVTEGAFLDSTHKNQILIGESLGEKLSINLRSRIVLTFQNEEGDITSAAFRVGGFFKSFSSQYDERNVFVNFSAMQQYLGEKIEAHEIALLLHDMNQIETVKEKLQAMEPSLLVETWTEIIPMIGYMLDMMDTFMMIMIGVILFGVMFGIINTMLMAILERAKEIGIMLSIGMNKTRIFIMILTETILLTMIGVPFGFIPGYLTVEYFAKTGIDFSVFSEALASFGFTTVVYPQLELAKYGTIALMVFVVAIIAAIFPAYRALQYKPAEAIRKI